MPDHRYQQTTDTALFIGGSADGKTMRDPETPHYKKDLTPPLGVGLDPENPTCEIYVRDVFYVGAKMWVFYILQGLSKQDAFNRIFSAYGNQ